MRRWGWIAVGSYSACIAVVLLMPSADLPSTVVERAADALGFVGAPEATTVPYRLEFLLNALMVVPIIAAGRLHFSGTSWRDWSAWTFVVAAGVEAFQGLLLPGRSATFVDVTANTTGAIVGALSVSAIGALRQGRTANEAQSAP